MSVDNLEVEMIQNAFIVYGQGVEAANRAQKTKGFEPDHSIHVANAESHFRSARQLARCAGLNDPTII